MNFFKAMDISASGLTAQRLRMDVISENIANQSTTRTANGTPYRRKYVVLQQNTGSSPFAGALRLAMNKASVRKGVRAIRIGEDQSPFKLVYDPEHPDANEEGFVAMPNINIVDEMVDLVTATRAYQANVTALDAAKQMALKALEIGRG